MPSGSDADGPGANGFPALDIVRRIADDIHGFNVIAPSPLGNSQGIAGQVVAVVVVESKTGMVKIKILRQAEEIHLQAGTDATVPRQEELPVAFPSMEEGQVFLLHSAG